ncbi:hypothetical protein EIP86_000133 [Pleurotus ostreatoroseus]|nr:hypothetical protein EIP86_000133 [Pleurotus ostreatoroseus]
MPPSDNITGVLAAVPATEPGTVDINAQQVDAFVAPVDASPAVNDAYEAMKTPADVTDALAGDQQRDIEMRSEEEEPSEGLSDTNKEPSATADGVDESNEEAGRDAHDLAQVPKARSKTRAEREAAKGKKADNQGRFRGEALVWMESMYVEYLKIDKTKGSRGKNKRLGDFWYHVRVGLWGAFTWQDLDVYGDNDEETVVASVNNVSKLKVDRI